MPAVFKVAEKVPAPPLNVALAGSTAAPSELVKWTVSPNVVMVWLFWSTAVTLKLKLVPAVALDGADTTKCGAGVVDTEIGPEVPVIEPLLVSVAVMVCVPAVRNVARNVPVPFVRVELAGSVAEPSRLVKWTVPANEVMV